MPKRYQASGLRELNPDLSVLFAEVVAQLGIEPMTPQDALWLVVALTKAPPVENFAWLPVGYKANKTGRGSVSLA